jgi:hypothetical protein
MVVEVRFSAPLDRAHSEDLNASNVTVKTLPSGTPLTVKTVSRVGGTPRRLQIFFTPATLPAGSASDSQIEVCFATLHFVASDGSPATTSSPLCEKGTILNSANVAAELERQFQVLAKTEKTSEEKNIFASGFATKGEGGNAEGGAEINLNSNDLNVHGLTAFMRLKKATAENADPKNFEVGLNQSTTNLIGKGDLALIRQYIAVMRDPSASDDDKQKAAQSFRDLLNKRQRRLLGGMFFDFAAKLEGQALNFDVTNFVGDGSFQLQSRTKKFFGSTNGFMRFRLMPAGLEVGYKVSNDPAAQQAAAASQNMQNQNWLARFKFGGVLTLFYKNNSETAGPFKRLELNLQAVDRYLFRREVMFDQTTMTNIATAKGNKPWYQADLRVYFTDPDEGTAGLRAGFQLSFKRGSLPPVFSQTKSFQFGFILESTEQKK